MNKCYSFDNNFCADPWAESSAIWDLTWLLHPFSPTTTMRIIYLWTAPIKQQLLLIQLLELSFSTMKYPLKKNIWWIVCVTHQQSLVAPSSRFFLPRLPGQFEMVTPRQHQGLFKRKWQEQDVQNISAVSGAVPRHVLLHSRVLTWRLRAPAGAFQGPGLFMYLRRGWGKGTTTLSVMKAYRFP